MAVGLLAALLVLAGAASAAPPAAPTTANPSSPAWPADYQARVARIFSRLLAASGYDSASALKKDRRGVTELRFLDDRRGVGGSPAVALAARTGPNKLDHAVVIVTYGALEIGDEDHLAFFLGHEIAHLVHEHPQFLQKLQMELFEKWYDANTERLAGMTPEQAAAAFAREKGATLGQLAKPLEREADADGIGLMAAAGFDQGKAGEAMDKAQDWLWALKLDADDPSHDPLAVRAAQLKAYAAQMGRSKSAAAKAAAVIGAPAN